MSVKRTNRHEVGGSSSNSTYFVIVFRVLSSSVEKSFPSSDTSIVYWCATTPFGFGAGGAAAGGRTPRPAANRMRLESTLNR